MKIFVLLLTQFFQFFVQSSSVLPQPKGVARSPLIVTNRDDDYISNAYSNLKYRADDSADDTKTGYNLDTLNAFVIPFLLGFNPNNKNLTITQLIGQISLLTYGIILKAIDKRLYENNRIIVENINYPAVTDSISTTTSTISSTSTTISSSTSTISSTTQVYQYQSKTNDKSQSDENYAKPRNDDPNGRDPFTLFKKLFKKKYK
jgi:hypothetical protein